jgi:hypothetical protein
VQGYLDQVTTLRGDELFQSLAQPLGWGHELPTAEPYVYKMRWEIPQTPRRVVRDRFAVDPSLARQFIPFTSEQALLLMNQPQLAARMNAAKASDTPLARILKEESDDSRAISKLYQLTLARLPRPSELQIAREYIEEAESRDQGFEDLLWTLLNSTELAIKP